MRATLKALLAVVPAALLLAAAAPASAEAALCRGELVDAIIDGSLIVPAGAACTLRHVTVRRDLFAGRGSILRIADDVLVVGNLAGDRCAYLSFEPASAVTSVAIGGNVEIERCREASGKLFAAGEVEVAGNFLCHDNFAPCFAVNLSIRGNVLILSNSGGMSYIEGNTIGGDLDCRGNGGVSDYGQPNAVGGKKLGECARLSNRRPVD
ncbi:MAG TPA: hypothetical protein VM755_12545 [Stellaceae bacterium]|nr:hypothetical protein [Stellaceae bacterium]